MEIIGGTRARILLPRDAGRGAKSLVKRNGVTGGGVTLRAGPERRGGGGTRRKVRKRQRGWQTGGGGATPINNLPQSGAAVVATPLDCSYSHTYSCCCCCWSPRMYAYINPFGPPPPAIASLIGSHKMILLQKRRRPE